MNAKANVLWVPVSAVWLHDPATFYGKITHEVGRLGEAEEGFL